MPDTTIPLAVGDYLKFKDVGHQSFTRHKTIEGLITWVAETPAHQPLPSGRIGTPLFRAGSTVFIIQPWRVFEAREGGWWIAPATRYSLDDTEVIHHIPRTVR